MLMNFFLRLKFLFAEDAINQAIQNDFVKILRLIFVGVAAMIVQVLKNSMIVE